MPNPAYAIHLRLTELALSTPDAPFLLPSAGRPGFTYQEFDEAARRVASVFAQFGVRKGDRIHVQLGNRWELLAALFGASLIGAVLVPTPPGSPMDDVAFITSQCDCRLSVMSSDDASIFEGTAELAPSLQTLLTVGPGAGTPTGSHSFDAAVAAARPLEGTRRPDERELIAILYTSGVTGWPKGVMLTQANMRHAGAVVAGHIRLIPQDRWLISLPLSHLNALGYSTMSALYTGASIGFVDPEEGWLACAAAQGSTVASLFARGVKAILDSEEQVQLKHLRTVLFAQHLSGDVRRAFSSRFGTELLQIYGTTESVAPVIGDTPFHRAIPHLLGVPLPHARFRIVDERGRPVPVEQPGELQVSGDRGLTITTGYYLRDDLTEAAFDGEWLRTGDQLRLDQNGRVEFLGRITEILKPGPESVSAAEIERVVSEHPGVAEVAVLGRESPLGSEEIVAYIVLRDDDVTLGEITEWLGTRIAPYKLPDRLHIVESLPRSPVGKVLKEVLRSQGDTGPM